MNNKKMYIVIAVSILVVAIGVSLAYFGVTIIGNDTAKSNKVVTGNLELTFTDTNEISLDGMFPGDSIEKTISVKNTGSKDSSYNLIWTELNNGIINDELVIEATCVRLNSSGTEEGTCAGIEETPISSKTLKKKISIETKVTHQYKLKITFIDTGKPQNYNKNKTFSGKLGISESADTAIYCNSNNSSLTQGTEYVNGQYTYRYKQEGTFAISGLEWQNITADGWGVQLTDRTSTTAVTSELCTYIDNKPVVSMNNMFASTAATSIDLSSFDTSNVTNMGMMFMLSPATSIDLSGFDTSNVTDMNWMLSYTEAKNIDVSNFDTSKVTNMSGMFSNSKATTIDVSKFNTSKVTDMSNMFSTVLATVIDVSNFNTSKVTDMNNMFNNTKAKVIDVSNFDTSNVVNMSSMFDKVSAETLNISNFNTSKVTDLGGMFENSKSITTLNLSSFDTSNVTSMRYMFNGMTNLKTIYVGDKFTTNKVTDSENMFNNCTAITGSGGTKYLSSKIDKTYARIDGTQQSATPGYFTYYNDDTSSFATDSWATITKAVKLGNTSKYKIGDTRTINMGSYGTHTIRVANKLVTEECLTDNYSQSACGFVVEFKDIITTYAMGTENYPNNTIRTLLNNDIYNSLPSDLRNIIIDTKVVTPDDNDPSKANYDKSTDKLYLLGSTEVFEGLRESVDFRNKAEILITRRLSIYNDITWWNLEDAAKTYNSTNVSWWVRTPGGSSAKYYIGNDSNSSKGVSPAFRIG